MRTSCWFPSRERSLWNQFNLGAAIGLTGIAAGCAVEPTAVVEEVRSATLEGRSTDG